MNGFWAGGIPPWAYVTFAAACLLFLCVGELDGWRRGEREAREDQRDDEEGLGIEQPPELAPGYMRGYRLSVNGRPVYSWNYDDPAPFSPEVAHEAWLAHEEQALRLANVGGGLSPSDQPLDSPAPDLRPDLTDSQWMAYKLADLDQYMAGLLGTHPATEEL